MFPVNKLIYLLLYAKEFELIQTVLSVHMLSQPLSRLQPITLTYAESMATSKNTTLTCTVFT